MLKLKISQKQMNFLSIKKPEFSINSGIRLLKLKYFKTIMTVNFYKNQGWK